MSRTGAQLRIEVLNHGFSATRYGLRIDSWLQIASTLVARRLKLPERRTTEVITTVAGQSSYALPSGFVRLDGDGWALRRTDTSPDRPIPSVDLNQIQIGTEDQGEPYAFSLDGGNLILFPTPDAVYPLLMGFYGAAGLISESGPVDLPDGADTLLVDYSLWRAYLAEHDPEMSNHHKGLWLEGLTNLATDQYMQDPSTRQVGGMLDYYGGDAEFEFGMRRP